MVSASRIGAVCLLSLWLAGHAAWAAEPGDPPEITYHLAPNGSARGDGSEGQPFSSISAAQRAVRAVLREEPGKPVTVVAQPGVYRLEKPLTFTPADSGTPEAPVTYRAGDGGKAVLSGGMPITGWKQDGKLWRATIREVQEGNLYFHQLFVGGRRARRAATPNKFYLRTAGPIQPLGDRQKARRDPATKQGFRFRQGDFQRWENLDDVTVELYHSWTTSLHWIEDIDFQKRLVRFTNRCHWPVGYWEKFERYRIHNYFEALDSPGEWYLDRKTGTLHYWPLPGERMEDAEVVAPRLKDLVLFEGNPAEGRFVRNVRLKGLSFQHEDWDFDRTSTVDGQAHARQQNAAITAFGLRDSAIERCEIVHVGAHAIRLDEGCRDNRVVQCEIHDCGGGGIYIGPDAKVGYNPPTDDVKVQDNLIENNFIHHTSRLLGGSIGIWVGSSSRNRIRHNEISDFDYTGISVGWCWGRQTDIFQRENLIEYNHIHHNVGDILSDNGGIYVLGYSPGSVIRGNVIHHIRHYPYINDSRGIYLDGNTSEYLVENNLVYHIDSFGVTLKGQHNVVRNNIFAFCGDSGFNRLFKAHAKDFEYDPSTLRGNIVYQREGAMTSGYYAPRWTEIDRNLYWNTQGKDAVGFNDWSWRILPDVDKVEDASLADWQTLGRDPNSLLADPRFADREPGDFELTENSPAAEIGFEPFDYDRAGLYGPPEWVALPERIEREPLEYAPPPPSGFPLDYGFEQYEPGEMPLVVGRLMEAENCRIRVTDRAAAKGRKSLAFQDGPASRTWLPHWAVWLPRHERGKVTMSCDLLNDERRPARFRIEFRDWSADGWHGGPTVTIQRDGAVKAGGKTLAGAVPGRWAHLELRFAFGPDAPKTCTITLKTDGGETTTTPDVPFTDEQFNTSTWFGVSSLDNERTTYYLDNVKLRIDDFPE